MTERQTGFHLRQPEPRINRDELRERLAAVHAVEDMQRAELAIRVGDIALDRGESSLWTHALSRTDAWILCGPDRAS